MSSTDRQNRLLVAEDWKRIYQSYRNADFQNYDFDSLRRIMINYLRQNYPEDFNDYIESSEYLALVDLIAYLGQNIAFRIDLNARENFLELADRRESVLRLARLLSYNPKRNIAAQGLLKITSVSTTESFTDTNNVNLQNQNILWNDPSNANWQEQFIKVLNRAMGADEIVGKSIKRETIDGVLTEKYRFNTPIEGLPLFEFSKVVDGQTVRFEVVPTDIDPTFIGEETPTPNSHFSYIHRVDGMGPSSSNTGFFCYFKQGRINEGNFTITNPSPNQIVTIDNTNVNNTDVWLYAVDADGNNTELWTKVDSIEGNNIIYNSLAKDVRNIYGVLTKTDDKISLIFSDGVFGNLPNGAFRVYYRTSRNSNIIITPRDMLNTPIQIRYISKSGKIETLRLGLELQYTISNASQSESTASIKQRAPMTYYTQNRLITAEDYQIGPLTISQEIVKAKSVNRVSSGLSRYFDLRDSTGKYSKTNLFGSDGILFRQYYDNKKQFSFETRTDIEGVIVNDISPILGSQKTKDFYFDNITQVPYTDLGIEWVQVSQDTNIFTGYFQNQSLIKQVLGRFTTSILSLVKTNSHVKFRAPDGMHFDKDGELATGAAVGAGTATYKWVKIVSVYEDGTENTLDDLGPVIINDYIPNGSLIMEIRPFVSANVSNDVKSQIVDQIFAYKAFGLRYDRDAMAWKIILEENLDVVNTFSIGKEGNTSRQKLDSSWLLKFTTNRELYTIEYRQARYLFESDKEIKFYYDSSDKVYDSITGQIVRDKISILSNNNKFNSTENFTQDYHYAISEEYRDGTGYINSKKVEVVFYDSDDDGVVDDPNIFDTVVQINDYPTEAWVFQKKYISANGVETYEYCDNATLGILIFNTKLDLGPLSVYNNGQIFYFIQENRFEVYNSATKSTVITTDYLANPGRDKLKFHYVHAADDSTRIDPSASNLIDTYVLTRAYDNQFRQWLEGSLVNQPLPLSSDQLYISFGQELQSIKSLTDEIIYHPARYRILFGAKSDPRLQARFKIVKNEDLVLNDNDIKSRVINRINQFFSLENWDFGETFHFSELAAYVVKELAPDVVTFLIVPVQSDQVYGSLHEISCEVNEIFISGATVDDLDIIDAVTAERIKASGKIITSTGAGSTGIQSAAL
jgi:hypothetical protein